MDGMVYVTINMRIARSLTNTLQNINYGMSLLGNSNLVTN